MVRTEVLIKDPCPWGLPGRCQQPCTYLGYRWVEPRLSVLVSACLGSRARELEHGVKARSKAMHMPLHDAPDPSMYVSNADVGA